MDYDERQKQPVTLPPDLAHDLWAEIKRARDEAMYARHVAESRETICNDLLHHMKLAGLADHLPTIEEVQTAWRGDDLPKQDS